MQIVAKIPVFLLQFSSVVQLCLTLCDPMNCSMQASLSITNSWSLLKLMSIESVMPSNHLILCRPLLLPPQSFPASGSFQMSRFFASSGQSIGTSVSESVLSMNASAAKSLQSLSCVWLFATLWTAAHQASLSITNSQGLLKLMSIESVIPSNHFIFCHPLLLLP